MPFGLTIGTERATALQQSIQDELTKRGFSQDADPVMAEYITIMVINNKTAAQITTELEDLIGSDFDPSFTDWLFAEASKGATEVDDTQQLEPSASEPLPRDAPHVSADTSHRQPPPPRNNVYQQALNQALPSSAPSGHKRLASARSPSPSHPNKSRRTDLPTGPRAMTRNEGGANSHAHSRSLIDRIGGQNVPGRNANAPNGYQHDEIQSRIDNIVNSSSEQNIMMGGGYPGMGGAGGMDMSAMAGMANPMVFQDILMNQMALMAQMTSMMNGGQFVGPGGFPMQGMPGDIGIFSGGMNNGFQGQINGTDVNGRGRGRGGIRGGRGGGSNRGRGGSTTMAASPPTPKPSEPSPANDPPASHAPVVAPAPITPITSIVPMPLDSPAPQRLGYALPERPQSPTLCKFSIKCTNAQCRYAHPSPVATAESGVVLSNEACEKGKDCQDKDCIKSHVSPAVLNPQSLEHTVSVSVSPAHAHISSVPCRFGIACTRPGCSFSHPPRTNPNTTQCRFGAACTRAGCPFVHPEGRVLPSSFHRGLSTTAPLVTVSTPETGSMGGSTSHNKSVTFNKTAGPGQGVKEKLAQQMKEIEQRKLEAEKAVREAEAAAGKKDESKPVAIVA
ncbi:Nuclear polyadenylated RNA-binding protein nab2 [Termitomyces sp. T112]|nr:Nuclear polyadenylated RNA-binding protein nab2 [Termitomyces sp. T112]KAH0588790.1 hypothetical protein H2248_004591 [Termitomyces sp. 'cryptogamus']